MNKRITNLSKAFTQEYGDKMVTADKMPPIDPIPSNLPTLDNYILGCGGMPRGRVIEVHGPENSSKSTLAHYLSGQGSKDNPHFVTAWCDVEGSFHAGWATRMGQNLTQTIFPPDTVIYAEDYLRYIKWCIVNEIDFVVLDCLAALVTKSVGERLLKKHATTNQVLKNQMGFGDAERGLNMKEMLGRATFLSQVLMPDLMSGFPHGGKIYRLCHSKTCIYVVNQLRDNLDLRSFEKHTPGGKAVKFLYAARLQLTRKALSKETDISGEPLFQTININAVKNKVGTPFRKADFMLMMDGGFQEYDAAVLAIVKRNGRLTGGAGGHYVLDGKKIHTKEKVIAYIKEHPEVLDDMPVTTIDNKDIVG